MRSDALKAKKPMAPTVKKSKSKEKSGATKENKRYPTRSALNKPKKFPYGKKNAVLHKKQLRKLKRYMIRKPMFSRLLLELTGLSQCLQKKERRATQSAGKEQQATQSVQVFGMMRRSLSGKLHQ